MYILSGLMDDVGTVHCETGTIGHDGVYTITIYMLCCK